MSILVVGSVAHDTVSTPFGRVEEALGGSATFFSAAASFFAPVKVVAVVGTDFDLKTLDFLRLRGVDTSGLSVTEGRTFRWSGSYGADMGDATTLATFLNVFQDFQPQVPPAHRREPFVFLANIDPELQSSVLDQVERPRLVVCDTMNFWIAGKRPQLLRLLERVDVLVVNEQEVKDLTGETNPIRAARRALAFGPKRVVVKLGEYGVMLVGDRLLYRLPAHPVEDVVDPTGAGDSFAGGFVGYLAESGDLGFESMHRALLAGSVCASFAVEAFSLDRLRQLTRADLDRRCRELEHIAGWTWSSRLVEQG